MSPRPQPTRFRIAKGVIDNPVVDGARALDVGAGAPWLLSPRFRLDDAVDRNQLGRPQKALERSHVERRRDRWPGQVNGTIERRDRLVIFSSGVTPDGHSPTSMSIESRRPFEPFRRSRRQPGRYHRWSADTACRRVASATRHARDSAGLQHLDAGDDFELTPLGFR